MAGPLPSSRNSNLPLHQKSDEHLPGRFFDSAKCQPQPDRSDLSAIILERSYDRSDTLRGFQQHVRFISGHKLVGDIIAHLRLPKGSLQSRGSACRRDANRDLYG